MEVTLANKLLLIYGEKMSTTIVTIEDPINYTSFLQTLLPKANFAYN